MALQTIFLGTPNNNDGDSLYAGGTKINANFNELYTQLAGTPTTALRIDLGTPLIGAPVTHDILAWSTLNEQFIPSSSTLLRTTGGNSPSYLTLTNNTGKAGVDEDYEGQPNALEFILNGRRMWNFRATTTGTTALTRGTWHIGLGNPAATSLSISTRGVTVGGVDGLTVVRNSAEEVGASSVMVSTGSSGIILHQTPIIHPDNYKAASDSSGTIIHSGFVQNAIDRRGFAPGTSTVVGARGLSGGGAISSNLTLLIHATAFPTYIEGLVFNIGPGITVQPGAAVHYSYSTTGETAIHATNPNLMLVTVSSAMTRYWSTSIWTSTNNGASLDSVAATNTWFYVYLVATEDGNTTDFVATTSRDYASAQAKLTAATGGSAYKVVRRLGALKTTSTVSSDIASIEPFMMRREAGNVVRIDYCGSDQSTTGIGLIATNYGSSVVNLYASTVQAAPAVHNPGVTGANAWSQGIFSPVSATTANATHFSSVLVRTIPPLPGVTVSMDVYQVAQTSLHTLFFAGEPMVSSLGNTFGITGRIPLSRVKPVVGAVTSTMTISVVVSPDASYVSDASLSSTGVFGSTSGANIRYAVVNQTGGADTYTKAPPWASIEVNGYTLAR